MKSAMSVNVRSTHLLENGDVMSREEFHRRYSECEALERVELIEGVVYMPSPIKFEGHADEQSMLLEWLMVYARGKDDLRAIGPASLLLDDQNEPEPDAMLFRLRDDRFEGGYIKGAPELAVEIARSSVSRDLHQKKRAYERNGILEYLVWRTEDGAIDWFQLRDGSYVQRTPDAAGIIESEAFPGLRLNVPALLAHNRPQLLAAIQ
jgi:Uma2 family endonuclease